MYSLSKNKHFSNLPDILTVEEIAEFFSVDRHIIYRYVKNGDLKILPRLDGKGPYRILKQSLENFLNSIT